MTRMFDVTFKVYCSEAHRVVVEGRCNDRPLTKQERTMLLGIIKVETDLWPEELQNLPTTQRVEFDWEEAKAYKAALAILESAWAQGPVER